MYLVAQVAGPMSSRYFLRPSELADGAQLNQLYKSVTGLPRTLEAWRWEWHEGPFGSAPSYVIVHRETNAVVGHHGVIPIPLRFNGQSLRGARTENSMIDPAHRGKFMYPAFEAQILAQLIENYDAIFTTAGKGAPGVVRQRLGYVKIGDWHTYSPGWSIGYHAARYLPVGKWLGWLETVVTSRRVPGAELLEVDATARLVEVWNESGHRPCVAADRTTDFLDWRILRHPKISYRMGIIRWDGFDQAGVIWSEKLQSNNTRLIQIEDLFTAKNSIETFSCALHAIVAHYRGARARVVIRTLRNGTEISDAAHGMTPGWALKRGAGSPVYLKTRHADVLKAPWEMTALVTQGH